MNVRTLVTITVSALLLGALPSCADSGERAAGDTDRDTAAARPAGPSAAAVPATEPTATAAGPVSGDADEPEPGARAGEDREAAPVGERVRESQTTGASGRPPVAGDGGRAAAGSDPAIAEPVGGDASSGRASAPAPGTAGPDSILRATARAYESVRSIRASFEQRLENPLLGRTARSTGVIYQRQPDRFLMEFSDPAGDIIVSDGEFFWMYYPSVDSVQVLRTRRASTGLDLRSQFIGDPVRRFESTYHGTAEVRGRAAHVFTLVPREAAGYERLKVWIDARDHLVRRFELVESSGNVRHFELTDLAVNPDLPNDLFQFTPPPGARVVTR